MNWYEQAKLDWLCSSCCLPRAEGPIDVYLAERPDRSILNIVFGVGVGIAREDFLDAFGDGVAEKYLHIGRVFGPSDAAFPPYLSFRGKDSAFIRGDKRSTHRRCEACGSVLYHPLGSRYLVRRTPGFSEMMESQLNQLIVSEPLKDAIAIRRWPNLGVDPLPVLEEPHDGISNEILE